MGALQQFLPAAPTNDQGSITVDGRTIPVGSVSFASTNFSKQNHAVINLDYNQSTATQFRFRFSMTNTADIDNVADLPIFFASVPSKDRLFSATMIHSFRSNLINETRIAFRRSSFAIPVPGLTFPGLDSFPNITLDDLGVNIGLARQPSVGRLQIRAAREDDRLLIKIEDNGPGLNGNRKRKSGSGVGLANTRARLGQFYDDDFSLEIVDKKNHNGTVVNLNVPFLK